ncbi:MAG: ketoacyl-ACP synthase III [Deltaproteobacteria bacterium]|nr:ketoacyl-ACP synthase III [Deltaproteobacteria bacterium]
MEYAAQLTGTGSAFPRNRISNTDISQKLALSGIETSDSWIRERTGIAERRMSMPGNPEEHNSSLGLAAALNALKMAGKTPLDIDQIVYSTCTPDTIIPSTACWLQHKLGAARAWGMDLNAACSGFIYGLSIADQFIRSGQVKTALVIGAEILSSITNWEDRSSCILFGDGAGAAIVERTQETSAHRILSTHLLSDGTLWELLHIPAGGSAQPVTPEMISQNLNKIHMNGREIFKIAVRTLSSFALKALKKNQMTVDMLDWFIPHQANFRIIEAVAKRLNLPMEKVLVNVDRYGNTSSATVPTMMDEAVRDGRIQKGQTVLLDAFGAGLTYGAVLLRW